MNDVIMAFFFDLGDTLVERKPEVDGNSIKLLYAASGYETPSDSELPILRRRLKAAECATWNSFAPSILLQLTTLDEEFIFLRDQFYPVVLSRLGFAAPPRDVLDVLARRQLGPETFRCFPDVAETFVQLKRKGLKIGCVSNALPSAEGILTHLHLWECFDCVVLSYECGCLKPSKRIHAEALNRLGLTGQEVIFVDDRRGFVSSARSIYGLAFLLDRECHHPNERKLRKIGQLSDICLLLNSERLLVEPSSIAFSQLPLLIDGLLRRLWTLAIADIKRLISRGSVARRMPMMARITAVHPR